MTISPPGPRRLRPVAPPLGNYVRPGRNDHVKVTEALVAGEAITGVVLDAALATRHDDLRGAAHERGVARVLDTRALELATVAGFERDSLHGLPWASEGMHRPDDLRGMAGEAFISEIVSFASDNDVTAVIAPTHYLTGPHDPWLEVDTRLVRSLRRQLDAADRRDVCIYYRLALPGAQLRREATRTALIAALSSLPIDALWLKVHPFGTTSSGPAVLEGYITAALALQSLGMPLVAESSGTVGLALLAFNAVGGIEAGVTLGERFDVSSLLRPPPPDANPFAPPPRVYMPTVGISVSRQDAESIAQRQGLRVRLGCRERCCPRGWKDTIDDPRRHYLARRSGEIAALSNMPPTLRPGRYLEDFLRPATDQAVQLSEILPSLLPHRRRLESWRVTLGRLEHEGVGLASEALPPQEGRLRRRRGA